ncbi:hypothetical protein CS542_02025 [Pedobacter sp. IW39]|nr:hypothetical protein CS542_02025 [Pedobacter sp. IW39]
MSTKEGKKGKISFRLENSISQSTQTLQLADPVTYMNLYNEAAIGRDPQAGRSSVKSDYQYAGYCK